jgi:hypothetical protein
VSADLVGQSRVEFYRVTRDGFDRRCAEVPLITADGIFNVAVELQTQLRLTTEEVRALGGA